jgi:nonribosomal peptide synthetase DhbF
MPDIAHQLREDARIADELVATGGVLRPMDQVLITGITGFLGGQIAAALLASTRARLFCVVRGKSGFSAQQRLESRCRRLGVDSSRVVLVDGDLTSSPLADPELAERVDTVVHCAATVNLFAPYAVLRASNVIAPRTVIDFAARGSPKRIHYVSTIGIFLSPRYRSSTVMENQTVGGEDGLRNGYAQSKWVADTMMNRARVRGISVSVYRPAFVGWHSQTARYGEHDLVAMLLASSWQAGVAPRLDLQINSTPVDRVAETVVKLMTSPVAEGGTYHVVNRRAVRFVDLAELAGLKVVELAEWEAVVARRAPAFVKFAAMVRGTHGDEESGSAELILEHNRTYDDSRVREALGTAFRTPAVLSAADVWRFVRSIQV